MSGITTNTNQYFKIKCRNCEFETEVESMASFEHVANEHINQGDGFGYPHYEHVVEATQIFVIGRNV